jgi:hypothetical protein
MDHVEISLYILLVEKGATLPHSLCISIFSLFLLFFEFYIGEEGKKSMMEHLEGAFLLHWIYIGVCT